MPRLLVGTQESPCKLYSLSWQEKRGGGEGEGGKKKSAPYTSYPLPAPRVSRRDPQGMGGREEWEGKNGNECGN